MTDIFREVDEDIRREKYQHLWDRYGVFLIGTAVAIVVVAAAIVGWRAYQLSEAEDASASYNQALRDAEAMTAGEAATYFRAAADDLPNGYKLLARFQEAASRAEAGERDVAIQVYDEIAADDGADPVLRGLANIKAGLLLLDRGSDDDLRARLTPLAEPTAGWRNVAREILGFSAYKSGDYAAAKTRFDEIIADPSAPAGLRDRAHVMNAVLVPKLPAVAGGPEAGIPDDAQDGAQNTAIQ